MILHIHIPGVITSFILLFVCTLILPVVKLQANSEVESENINNEDALSVLTERTWQLVEIVSMNDTIKVPEEPTRYSILFTKDGTVEIEADCNRGRGSWTSTVPGNMQLGPIAATQAHCSPESLHDTFIAQFPWVRSYVINDGHLFLATMADGSIIEFEPVELPLAATVMGEPVRTNNGSEMQEIIVTQLFDHYAEENSIEVTDKEIDTYLEGMYRDMHAMGLDAENTLTEEEKVQMRTMRRDMAHSLIRQWKVNRSLYHQYGGRIIFQQFGPEPLDAYHHYLKERQKAGDFTIHRKDFEETFWRYFTQDSMHEFYTPGSEEEKNAFSIAPWARASNAPKVKKHHSSTQHVPAAPEDGGPLNWQVAEITGQLNLRVEPSINSKVIDRFIQGTILTNLGCKVADDRVWCDVQEFGGGPRGYVSAEFLVAAVSANGAAIYGPDDSSLRAGQGDFDATGHVPCVQKQGQPMTQCEFGVSRKGGGYATVVITKPDGMKRAIFFQLGIATGADTSQADGYPKFKVTRKGDRQLIQIGEEHYEIPDAVILGG